MDSESQVTKIDVFLTKHLLGTIFLEGFQVYVRGVFAKPIKKPWVFGLSSDKQQAALERLHQRKRGAP